MRCRPVTAFSRCVPDLLSNVSVCLSETRPRTSPSSYDSRCRGFICSYHLVVVPTVQPRRPTRRRLIRNERCSMAVLIQEGSRWRSTIAQCYFQRVRYNPVGKDVSIGRLAPPSLLCRGCYSERMRRSSSLSTSGAVSNTQRRRDVCRKPQRQ